MTDTTTPQQNQTQDSTTASTQDDPASAASSQDNKQPDSANSSSTPADDEMEKLRKDLAQMTEAARRAMADLQNYKKRSEEERKALHQFAAISLILELLPIVDNFKRAVQQRPEEISKNPWTEGIVNTEKQILDLLTKQGLSEIEAANQPFDAQKHEALMQGPGVKDQVIEVFETGYMLGDKVLKPAKVKVGNGE